MGQKTLFLRQKKTCFRDKKPCFGSKSLGSLEIFLFWTFQKLQKNDIKMEFRKSWKLVLTWKLTQMFGLKFGMQGLIYKQIKMQLYLDGKGKDKVGLIVSLIYLRVERCDWEVHYKMSNQSWTKMWADTRQKYGFDAKDVNFITFVNFINIFCAHFLYESGFVLLLKPKHS